MAAVRGTRFRSDSLSLSTLGGPGLGMRGQGVCAVGELWLRNPLDPATSLPDRFVVPSTLFTNAPEISLNP